MNPQGINPYQALDASGYPSDSGLDWQYGANLPPEYAEQYQVFDAAKRKLERLASNGTPRNPCCEIWQR